MATKVRIPFPLIFAFGYFKLYRPYQLRWGATDTEVERPMHGDDIVPKPNFNATRAVTIHAAPEQIFPWLVQIGTNRAGWYSYDWIDNQGKPSAKVILPEFQDIAPGDFIPMTPDNKHGMNVHSFEANQWLVWISPDNSSSFVWELHPIDDTHTRLVTRLRLRYHWNSPAILIELLMDMGEFFMMRKCMLGIKRRAEALPVLAKTGETIDLPLIHPTPL
jgi:hypothetical protein